MARPTNATISVGDQPSPYWDMVFSCYKNLRFPYKENHRKPPLWCIHDIDVHIPSNRRFVIFRIGKEKED